MNDELKKKIGQKVNKPFPKNAKGILPRPYLLPYELRGEDVNVRIRELGFINVYDQETFGLAEVAVFWMVPREAGKEVKPVRITSNLIIDQMIAATGTDSTDLWVGKSVCLFVAKEKHGPKMWDVIRVKAANKAAPDAPPMPSSTPVLMKDQRPAPSKSGRVVSERSRPSPSDEGEAAGRYVKKNDPKGEEF